LVPDVSRQHGGLIFKGHIPEEGEHQTKSQKCQHRVTMSLHSLQKTVRLGEYKKKRIF